MSAFQILTFATQQALDTAANVLSGATMTFSLTGTSTPTNAYADKDLTTPLANPLTADAAGNFVSVFLDPLIVYRVVLKTSAGVVLKTWDPANENVLAAIDSEFIGLTLDSLKRTAAEISAGVTPVNYAYAPGDVRRYGAVADGTTDNSPALQNALDSCAGQFIVTIPGGGSNYIFDSQISIPSKTRLEIQAGAVLEFTDDETPFLKGSGVTDVEIYGLGEVLGVQGDTDWPSPSTNAEGLIYFTFSGSTNCERIRISNIRVHRTWCPISCVRVQKLWISQTECHDFMRYGILASQSSDFHINHNTVYDSNTTGAVCYGIMATGDANGGNAQQRCSISLNSIRNITAWDGIMSHDCSRLTIIGNMIANVRSGIDIGPIASTNVCEDITIIGNNIRHTTTDAWSGSAAAHFGIGVFGLSSVQVERAVIQGNIIDGFGQMSGATYAGNPAPIDAEYISDLNISGNIIADADNVSVNAAGILLVGSIGRGVLSGNSIEGDLPNGSIALSSVTADLISIEGGALLQSNTASPAISVGSSTIGLALGDFATNSTTRYSESSSTVTWKGRELFGTATYDPPSLAAAATTTTTVTVTGAALGDHVAGVSFDGDLSGITVTGYVSSANTVIVRLLNDTAGVLDLGSGTLSVIVRRRH